MCEENKLKRYKDKNQKDHKLRTVLVFLICLLIGLSGILIIMLLNSRLDNNINTMAIVYDEDAEDTVSEIHYSDTTIIPCWDSMTFKARTTEQDVNFYNPASNEGINFKITLYSGGDVIYKSDLIQPGKVIKHIEIIKPMVAQIVSASVVYQCFTDDGVQLNGSKMNFTLKVEE